MSKETIVILRDDLDGTEATQTVTFGYQGATYEIDLNDKNAAALEKALAKYLAAARRSARTASNRSSSRGGAPGQRPRGKRAAGRSLDVAAIRAWAKQSGYEVSDRGRIAAAVVEAYNAAP